MKLLVDPIYFLNLCLLEQDIKHSQSYLGTVLTLLAWT